MAPKKNAEKARRRKLKIAPPAEDPVFRQMFQGEMSKGDLRKAEIVQAAIRVISQQGIEAASFEAIGEQLGIRKSHVAYHFHDKSDIIASSIQYIIYKAQQKTVELIGEAKTPRERILAMARAAFEWARENPDQVSVYCLFFHYCVVNAKYRQMHSEIRDAGAERLSALLATDEKISKKLNSDRIQALARILHAILSGEMLHLVTTNAFLKSADFREVENRCLRSFAELTDL